MTERGSFDAHGNLLMHGLPRFTLGVYDSGGGYSTDPAHWEQQIFQDRELDGIPLNAYLNYWMGGMPIDPTVALLDVLDGHGMMYLQTGNCFESGSWRRMYFSIQDQTYVQQYAAHRAALGYYIMDECTEELIPETEQHHTDSHAWDPEGITFACNYAAGYRAPEKWVDACDILGSDPYPLYGVESADGYTHFVVGDYISKLRAAHRPDRPVWAVLQFFQSTSDSRLPTFGELRAHAIMAIVEGANGIWWWDVGTNGIRKSLTVASASEYMDYLRDLVVELEQLEPVLLAPASPALLKGNSTRYADAVAGRINQLDHNIDVEWLYSRIEWYQAEKAALQAGDRSLSGGMITDVADVRTRVKRVGEFGYVFAYNYTNRETDVVLEWDGQVVGVTERDEILPVAGSSWSDTLGPYEGRIYVVQTSGDAPEPPEPEPEPEPQPVEFTFPVLYGGQRATARVTIEPAAPADRRRRMPSDYQGSRSRRRG